MHQSKHVPCKANSRTGKDCYRLVGGQQFAQACDLDPRLQDHAHQKRILMLKIRDATPPAALILLQSKIVYI